MNLKKSILSIILSCGLIVSAVYAERTYTYVLTSKGKVVYCGITNDPSRREGEHRADGKEFDTLEVTGYHNSRKAARESEKVCMCHYGKGHTCLPKLNLQRG